MNPLKKGFCHLIIYLIFHLFFTNQHNGDYIIPAHSEEKRETFFAFLWCKKRHLSSG